MDVFPSCRDKGWMRGKVGALCLSLLDGDSAGVVMISAGSRPRTRTSTRPPHPPHPAPCPYRTGREIHDITVSGWKNSSGLLLDELTFNHDLDLVADHPFAIHHHVERHAEVLAVDLALG